MLPRLVRLSRELPVASTSTLCPGCRAGSSLALPISYATQKQRASSWAALSLAGSAMFGAEPSPRVPAVQAAPVPKARPLVADLLDELKLARPDAERVWLLFSQLDLLGGTGALKAGTYATLVKSLYERAPPHLSVLSSTALAHTYASKVDLVLLRMRQAGHTDTLLVQNSLLKQYATLKYGPAVCQVWDARLVAGHLPNPKMCSTVFQALVDWIELHREEGGRVAAQAAAAPLVNKLVAMLEDMGQVHATDVVLDSFFEIVKVAGDFDVFKVAMKAAYGYDVELPGSHVEPLAGSQLKRKHFGEKELLWVLKMLDSRDDLSSMIACFEVADNPAPTTVPEYFGQSFSSAFSFSSSTASPAPTTAAPLPTPYSHPVGTQAYTIMIMAASRLDRGPLLRHYFKQLSLRWQSGMSAKIALIEAAVGIVMEESKPLPLPVTEVEAPASDALALDAPALDAAVAFEPSTEPLPPTTVVPAAPSLPVYPSPERDYHLPSTLVNFVLRQAKDQYDTATAKYIRARTKQILHLTEQHIERISAVAARLQPVASMGVFIATPESTKALDALHYEIDRITFHQIQLRFMLGSIKAQSNIVYAYACLRRLVSDLRGMEARLARSKGVEIRYIKSLGSALRRKAALVTHARRLLIRQRMARLSLEGKADTTDPNFRNCLDQLARLDSEAEKWQPIDRELKRGAGKTVPLVVEDKTLDQLDL